MNRFAAVNDRGRIAYFQTQAQAATWGAQSCAAEYAVFRLGRRLPGTMTPVGGVRRSSR